LDDDDDDDDEDEDEDEDKDEEEGRTTAAEPADRPDIAVDIASLLSAEASIIPCGTTNDLALPTARLAS